MNHRMLWLGRDDKNHLVSPHCHWWGCHALGHVVPHPALALHACRDGQRQFLCAFPVPGPCGGAGSGRSGGRDCISRQRRARSGAGTAMASCGWARAVRGLLLDVSGVLYDSGADGGVPIAGSAEAVRRWVGGGPGRGGAPQGTAPGWGRTARKMGCLQLPLCCASPAHGTGAFGGQLGAFEDYLNEGNPQSLG